MLSKSGGSILSRVEASGNSGAVHFEPYSKKSDWTFWTYARKSLVCFGTQGKPIEKRLRKQKAFIRKSFLRQL